MPFSVVSSSSHLPELPSPCVLRVLQTAWDNSSTSAACLAKILFLSPCTVDTYFERAMRLAEVHERGGLMAEAVKRGWIVAAPIARQPANPPTRQPAKWRYGEKNESGTPQKTQTVGRDRHHLSALTDRQIVASPLQ